MAMLELNNHTTLLVDLHFAIYWNTSKGHRGQKFAPVAFAASLLTEDPEIFTQALDASCLARIKAVTKYTMYQFEKPLNFEVERSIVWKGYEDAKLSIRGLSAAELEDQLRLMKGRKYQDCVRVQMAVEIEAGQELSTQGWD